MKHAAEEGFSLTMTCQRGHLPKDIPAKCWHKDPTNAQTTRTRAARWEFPVVTIKEHVGALIQRVGFQSTSACDFACVNALNGVSLFAQTMERGKGNKKQQWGIEMNEAWQLCLKSIGKINTMDDCPNNCDMFCR